MFYALYCASKTTTRGTFLQVPCLCWCLCVNNSCSFVTSCKWLRSPHETRFKDMLVRPLGAPDELDTPRWYGTWIIIQLVRKGRANWGHSSWWTGFVYRWSCTQKGWQDLTMCGLLTTTGSLLENQPASFPLTWTNIYFWKTCLCVCVCSGSVSLFGGFFLFSLSLGD